MVICTVVGLSEKLTRRGLVRWSTYSTPICPFVKTNFCSAVRFSEKNALQPPLAPIFRMGSA